MSSSTTLKLPDELKKRIAPLAQKAGKTPHAWMVEALEQEAARSEMRESFIRDALDAAEATDVGGPVYGAEDVHAWLRAKVAGKRTVRPRPVKRRRSAR